MNASGLITLQVDTFLQAKEIIWNIKVKTFWENFEETRSDKVKRLLNEV